MDLIRFEQVHAKSAPVEDRGRPVFGVWVGIYTWCDLILSFHSRV